jgi:hypothetical protein
MRYLKKRGYKAWQSWGIASTLCVIQAYVVAKFMGWNLGGYIIILIAMIPSLLSGQSYQQTNGELGYWFWLLPPVVLILIPSLLLYLFDYRNRPDKNDKQNNQENA